jgi:hypothetical protein
MAIRRGVKWIEVKILGNAWSQSISEYWQIGVASIVRSFRE